MDRPLELPMVETSGLDLIDKLLQANRTSPELQEYCNKGKDGIDPWTLDD